ncbi:hypothetical protein [Roseiflexus sp.]|uniref:hypothetical protein n=1 Tax=Roseiflexus TaxID=120961 RepID=UPI0021DCF9DE|nr:hypothetical protein [Roseiflexus sp.]GIW02123.1 MAG: hypothetical protein KatS3mg058_3526 [Roseiflexus sp.]GIW03369.1 MAG: hypothetical protein KatS3mg058_4772 [Roseiflexus sp.]
MIVSRTVTKPHTHRWMYPLVYALLLVVFFLPLYTEKPYAPQETSKVIQELLVATSHPEPYTTLAPLFHLATIALIALIAWRPARAGRILAAYMGVNYLIIGWVQGQGVTETYGYVVQIGNVVACALLGIMWLIVAFQNRLSISFERLDWRHYALAPLALLAFWAPAAVINGVVYPDFNPLLLLTSPAYGLSYCLTTPVFLFLLIIALPNVPPLAYRITAFNALPYGLVNMMSLFDPALWWMGILHIPLLALSIVALIAGRWAERRALHPRR